VKVKGEGTDFIGLQFRLNKMSSLALL